MQRSLFLAVLVLAVAHALPASAQSHPAQAQWAATCKDWDDWDKPAPPFRIHANTWYVGTCGISAILVTSRRGHILIDTGTEKGAEVVAANIRRLGFRLKDVKLLLHSHEHFDHVGGHETIRRLTGAQVIASKEATPALTSGRDSDGDPQAGGLKPFAAMPVARIVSDGEAVRLGPLTLTAHATPGHTPGALSWTWTSCAQGRRDCRRIVFADSLSAISADAYRFSAHPAYVATFRTGIARVAALPCDILLTPHPSASAMRDRLERGALTMPDDQCRSYARTAGERLDERLAREAGDQR